MERAVARALLPRSGDSSNIPPSVRGGRAERGRGPRRSPTPQPAAWVLVLVVVALVPLLVATWTFGRSYRTSEIGQVDSRLTATASGLTGELGAAANRTSRVGLSMARSVFHRELPTVVAGAVTLLALGVLAALALPRFTALRARSGGGDWRRPVALVGDVAVAAHDPDALLPVILETALVATEADGGAVVWEGNEIASLGDTRTPRRVLSLPLGDE